MKFKVPFYKQEGKNDCGPTALQMVLEYLGEKHSREELMNSVDSDKSGVTWTLGIAKAAAELGFKVEFYSAHVGFNPENFELEFLKKYADDPQSSKQKIERLQKQAYELGVKIQEKSISLKELLSNVSKNCIPIILLDWSKIKGTSDFIGHYVPIVGYDDENVYVHNQGFHNTKAFLPIARELFDEARKSKGTDEDIAYIYRKNK